MSVVGFCASTYLHPLRAAPNSIFLLDSFPLMGKRQLGPCRASKHTTCLRIEPKVIPGHVTKFLLRLAVALATDVQSDNAYVRRVGGGMTLAIWQ
jgi:hypothetical protein